MGSILNLPKISDPESLLLQDTPSDADKASFWAGFGPVLTGRRRKTPSVGEAFAGTRLSCCALTKGLGRISLAIRVDVTRPSERRQRVVSDAITDFVVDEGAFERKPFSGSPGNAYSFVKGVWKHRLFAAWARIERRRARTPTILGYLEGWPMNRRLRKRSYGEWLLCALREAAERLEDQNMKRVLLLELDENFSLKPAAIAARLGFTRRTVYATRPEARKRLGEIILGNPQLIFNRAPNGYRTLLDMLNGSQEDVRLATLLLDVGDSSIAEVATNRGVTPDAVKEEVDVAMRRLLDRLID